MAGVWQEVRVVYGGVYTTSSLFVYLQGLGLMLWTFVFLFTLCTSTRSQIIAQTKLTLHCTEEAIGMIYASFFECPRCVR